jgi:adenylosuccinate synthase
MIVIGLGFGDEGKGLTTSYLCSQCENPLVVRFNGGHQAGHTVVKDGVRHVSSTFGAGVLYNIPTYISEYCTFFPTAMLNELYKLQEDNNINPRLIVHPLCPVTTPFDLAHNQKIEDERGSLRHGSVGVGFGATIQRQEDHYKLFVQDLEFPNVVWAKLQNIARYYGMNFSESVIDLDLDSFMEDIKYAIEHIDIMNYDDVRNEQKWDLVLEGAQGVLLDQDHGFFPNVTRSNTTTKNAIEIWYKLTDGGAYPDIYYVTRTYQTRHGAGYMSNNDDIASQLINNENETNISHDYQGQFRIGSLDPEMLNYALYCDFNYASNDYKKHLVVTCMDQFPISIETLKRTLIVAFETIYVSNGPSRDNITEYKVKKNYNFSII